MRSQKQILFVPSDALTRRSRNTPTERASHTVPDPTAVIPNMAGLRSTDRRNKAAIRNSAKPLVVYAPQSPRMHITKVEASSVHHTLQNLHHHISSLLFLSLLVCLVDLLGLPDCLLHVLHIQSGFHLAERSQ